MANFTIQQIKGVIPALVTPFDRYEEFDANRMRRVVNSLIDKGVDGLYLTGSTGETFLMTPDERKKVVEIVVDEVAGRIPLIAHIGAIGSKLSEDLAKHAYANGIDALSSVPPFYWKFSDDQIFTYYERVTNATPLPMIIYNIPLAGLVGFPAILRLASIEGVEGIKYTATTHSELHRIKKELGNDFLVYSGCDEMAMSGLVFGADGIIGSFYNLIPEIFKAIYQAVKEGDLKKAQYYQDQANTIIYYFLGYDFLSLIKRGMSWSGVDAGYCRSPFKNYSKAEEAEIKAGLRVLKERSVLTDVEFAAAL